MTAKKRTDWAKASQHIDMPAPIVDAIPAEDATPRTDPAPNVAEPALQIPAEPIGTHQPSAAEKRSEGRSASPEAISVHRPRRRLPPKHPVTYRLPFDVIDLIEVALDDAYERGEKLSKEEAVAAAIRQTYGHLSNP